MLIEGGLALVGAYTVNLRTSKEKVQEGKKMRFQHRGDKYNLGGKGVGLDSYSPNH